jgi:hypothetical protein
VASQEDVRRIALALPETGEGEGHFAFSVRNKDKQKGFCWVWAERVHPKKARVPNPDVLAVRVADLDVKDTLLEADPQTFFTEPHYNGFPAVLVRLPKIGLEQLTLLIGEAWRCQAPRALVEQYERAPGPSAKPAVKSSANPAKTTPRRSPAWQPRRTPKTAQRAASPTSL